MRLSNIIEEAVDHQQTLEMLGLPAQKVFGAGRDSLPPRYIKRTKTEVDYQIPTPKPNQRCQNCKNFSVESNQCRVVEGKIDPNAWCKMWSANES